MPKNNNPTFDALLRARGGAGATAPDNNPMKQRRTPKVSVAAATSRPAPSRARRPVAPPMPGGGFQ